MSTLDPAAGGISFSDRITNFIYTPYQTGAVAAASFISTLFEPRFFENDPDLEIVSFQGRQFRVVHRQLGRDHFASIGSNYNPFSTPVVFVPADLKQLNQDAFHYFLKREVYLIDSTRGIVSPAVQAISTVAFSALAPAGLGLIPLIIGYLAIPRIASSVVNSYYSSQADAYMVSHATDAEKRGALFFYNAADDRRNFDFWSRRFGIDYDANGSDASQIRLESLKKLLKDPVEAPVYGEERVRPRVDQLDEIDNINISAFFRDRSEKYRNAMQTDIPAILLPIGCHVGIALVANHYLPFWSVMALGKALQPLSKRIVRPFIESQMLKNLADADQELDREDRQAARAWLAGYQNDARLRQILPIGHTDSSI